MSNTVGNAVTSAFVTPPPTRPDPTRPYRDLRLHASSLCEAASASMHGSSAASTLTEDDDLDLLDDAKRHARCILCTGEPGDLVGVPFIAICGRRAINLRVWPDPAAFPPDACPECVALFDQPCPRCGA